MKYDTDQDPLPGDPPHLCPLKFPHTVEFLQTQNDKEADAWMSLAEPVLFAACLQACASHAGYITKPRGGEA